MLSVIVITYNSASTIGPCLDALRGAEFRELVVWDNNSKDGTLNVLAGIHDPRLVVLQSEENLGFAAAVNRAAQHTTGDLLLLLNPDAIAPPAALEALEDVLSDDPTIGAVAPRMLLGHEVGVAGGAFPTVFKELVAWTRVDDVLPAGLQSLLLTAFGRLAPGSSIGQRRSVRDGRGTVDVDWVSGFCLMTRRDIWQDLQGLDERFFMYFEDVAFCRRLADAGFRAVVARDVEVLHLESASTREGPRGAKNSLYLKSMKEYFASYGTPIQRWVGRRLQMISAL